MTVRTTTMLAIAGLVLATGVGCGPQEVQAEPWPHSCPNTSSGSLAIVLGARDNSPEPQLPKGIEELVVDAADAGHTLVGIPVDGKPTIQLEATFQSDANNETARRDDLVRFVEDFRTELSKVQAEADEADPLTALDLAGRTVGEGGTVVMVDSGLQTTDPLDFREQGMLDADPNEITEYLETNELLPNLQKRSVVFSGLGDVAEPQQPLSDSQANLIAIWKAVSEHASATCTEVLERPITNPTRENVPSVSTVEVPDVRTPQLAAEKSDGCSQTVLRDAGSVKFVPDQAEFIDPAAARQQLRGMADEIADKRLRAKLLGTTSSWGTPEGRERISRQRAEAVQDVLVDLGVPADRLTAKGVGVNWSGYVDDRGPNNELLPGPAARNRAVVVRVGCDG